VTTTSLVPGSELFFSDTAASMPYALPTDTLVGSGPVFSDASDATYGVLALVHGHPLGTDTFIGQRMYARIQAAALTTTGLSVSFRTDQATTDVGITAPARLDIGIMDKDGAGFTEADFALSLSWQIFPEITVSSGFTTYTADLTTPVSNPYGRTVDDVVALIAAGDAWLFLGTFGNAISGFDGKVESHVSEVSIFDTEQPPLRTYPRGDDKAAVPSSRVWPVPKSDTRVYSQEP
jgi:hypothetical protein